MTETNDKERAELLAALQAAGAASDEDQAELEALLEADPSLRQVVRDFQDSITALASSFDPLETPPRTLAKIQREISKERGGLWSRIRGWFSRA